MEAQFKPIADHGVLVSFAKDISNEAHQMVLSLDQAISAKPPKGVIETTPALVNLMISFDVETTDHTQIEASLRDILQTLGSHDHPPHKKSVIKRRIQICYEPPFAHDLDAVAKATGLSAEAVIQAHLAGEYDVLMYGFAPGYAYMSGVQGQIQVPRKPAPVRDVPAGSVIIAGAQCLVTTLCMPTGWSRIGRSPTPIFTGDPSHPFLFDVGDRVEFERISLKTFETLRQEPNDV